VNFSFWVVFVHMNPNFLSTIEYLQTNH
jgi:hypothetical protein